VDQCLGCAVSCNEYNLVWTEDACRAIVQGITFDWLTFLYPADISTYTPRGQVRRNFAELDLTIDASFSFASLTYGTYTIGGVTYTNVTKVRPILTDEQTQALPASKRGIVAVDGAYVTITGADGVEKKAAIGTDIWVYDVEAESPGGTVVQVAHGLVQVLQDVTRS
jgi:hypothetical protein